jgi:hypothetical protein
MSNTTKGVWHRPEAEKGAYANGYDRIWGKADAVREMPEAPGSDEAGSGAAETSHPV